MLSYRSNTNMPGGIEFQNIVRFVANMIHYIDEQDKKKKTICCLKTTSNIASAKPSRYAAYDTVRENMIASHITQQCRMMIKLLSKLNGGDSWGCVRVQ